MGQSMQAQDSINNAELAQIDREGSHIPRLDSLATEGHLLLRMRKASTRLIEYLDSHTLMIFDFI